MPRAWKEENFLVDHITPPVPLLHCVSTQALLLNVYTVHLLNRKSDFIGIFTHLFKFTSCRGTEQKSTAKMKTESRISILTDILGTCYQQWLHPLFFIAVMLFLLSQVKTSQ